MNLLVQSCAGGSRQDIHIQLCEVLSETQLAIILDRVPEKNWNEMYSYYLGDILRSIHHVPHHRASDEYEVWHVLYRGYISLKILMYFNFRLLLKPLMLL